jgi:DNA repair protein RadD
MSIHDTKLVAAAADRELIEAWRAVANAKLKEFRRQAWRLALLTRKGVVPKAAAVDSAMGNRDCACTGAVARRRACSADHCRAVHCCGGGMSADLYPHQVTLLYQIDAAIAAGCHRIVAQAPTGFGKTKIAAHRLRRIQAAGKRAEGVRDVGVIQADHIFTNYARPIQVASVQTLQRRQIPDADEIIIDEIHKFFKLYPELLANPRFESVPIIGLSATPWRRGLGKYFHKLIIGSTTKDLIDDGYLSGFRVFAPASPDLSGVSTVAGDYHEGELGAAMNKTILVADVVTTWLERAQGRPTLCFAVDRAHAKNLQAKFIEAEVPAAYIDCYTGRPERNVIARQFHAGDVQVVCNVGCLTTGIDWDVRCIILARPTKSEMLFVQMIGRGLRTADGKDDCLVLDHSDNHIRLGFVTDIYHDELDDGRERLTPKRKAPEALPKKCPKCTFLKPPKTLACPCCGHVPAPPPGAIHRDGQLIEMDSRRSIIGPTSEERQDFFQQLRAVAQLRGYKDGWTAHKYKERFGHFPPWDYKSLQPKTPSDATFRWVKSRAIAFAKSRAVA